jgi:hypothetical protein
MMEHEYSSNWQIARAYSIFAVEPNVTGAAVGGMIALT